MTSTLTLLAAIDALYRGVVTEPADWSDQAIADWAEDLAGSGLTPAQTKGVRRCLRAAIRLRDLWERGRTISTDDWRSRVDVALGAKAWRPTLDLARSGLDTEPSAELFDEVGRRFRLVHSEPWMDGLTFDEWFADLRASGISAPEVE